MYCRNCGSEIDDRAAVCPKCGVPTGVKAEGQSTNVLAIVGFVLSFFMSIAGLVCSIIARKQIRESGEKGMSFATAGMIISIVSMVLSVVAVIISLLIVFVFASSIPYYYQ